MKVSSPARRRPSWFLRLSVLSSLCPLCLCGSLTAQDYRVEDTKVFPVVRERDGKKSLYVTLQFRLKRGEGDPVSDVGPTEKIVVEEDRHPVTELEVRPPRAGDLTAALAMDVSGSMDSGGKMEQARRAGITFLDRLHPKADCGLILFDDQIRANEPPARDARALPGHRDRVRQLVSEARPGGGTAWVDATAAAVEMLRGAKGRRAVVVMTDGVDLSSKRTLQEVIALAKEAEVTVYALGVGEPGRNEPVATVLTLDRSGSMTAQADVKDGVTKIEALRRAAVRFVDLMRPTARTTVLPFGNRPETPGPFTDDRDGLRKKIQSLEAKGETALFDATYDALMTLELDAEEAIKAGRPAGKRSVVALTDGIDNRSVRRVEEVIGLAREMKVPLYVLGFGRVQAGRTKQLDEAVMKRMARETGGEYYHAQNQEALTRVFENLSIWLHDDGIDEAALKRLAEETGGKYYPARDVRRLSLIYEELADELQTTFTVTFPSRRDKHDGTARGIDIRVLRDGVVVSDVGRADYHVFGVLVPETDHRVYLALLGLVGGLLALPAGMRRLYRFYGGG